MKPPLVIHGDARALPLADNSIDACVTDPPYALRELPARLVADTLSRWLAGDRAYVPAGSGFMGRGWDNFVPPPAAWDEAVRVLKPGGHILAFCAPRTVDLLTLSMRLAGLRIVDQLAWIFGNGMPKGVNVDRAIDKAAGVERKVVGPPTRHGGGVNGVYAQDDWTQNNQATMGAQTTPATPEAAEWAGWNSTLKPAHECIVLAQKPIKASVAENVLAWGTGALNIAATRVPASDPLVRPAVRRTNNSVLGNGLGAGTQTEPDGRFPPNLLLSHLPILDEHGEPVGDACAGGCQPGCPVAEMDRQSGTLTSGVFAPHHVDNGKPAGTYGVMAGRPRGTSFGGDSGGASRFFPVFRYQPKAPGHERPRHNGYAHTTVKPEGLMAWCVQLITRPGGLVLDQFAGSGPTLQAAASLGCRSIGVELDAANLPLIRQRLARRRASRSPVPAVKPVGGQLGMFEGEATG